MYGDPKWWICSRTAKAKYEPENYTHRNQFHKQDKREREKGPWKITNAKIKNPPITIIENGCMQFRNRVMKAWLFRN